MAPITEPQNTTVFKKPHARKMMSSWLHVPVDANQIVALPAELSKPVVTRLKQNYSINQIAHTRDFHDSSWLLNKTSGAELLMFDHLGMGLLMIDDPDKLNFLQKRSRRWRTLRILRPESSLRILDDDLIQPETNTEDTESNESPWNRSPRVQRLLNDAKEKRGFEDNSRQSWAMQACGINHTRWNGQGVKIAILDTGLDFHHRDWIGRPLSHRSFIDESAQDYHGHGTQCAGLAAGSSSDQDVPRFGSAPQADLYIAKVLQPDGSGPDSAILAGIDWALGQGCQILSLSVGIQTTQSTPDPVYEQVAQRCLKSGLLFMAAAGNDSVRPNHVRPVCRPANCPSILAVGAVDRFLRIAPFSNGSSLMGRGQIDAVAPGVDVFTTSMGTSPYGRFSGTSMAAPLCAGVAALVIQDDPDCLGTSLWHRMATLARRLPLPSTDVGMGLVSLSLQKK